MIAAGAHRARPLQARRSPLLRAAFDDGNWHILKWNHLRSFVAARAAHLDDLEPLLGLDPAVERAASRLPLFGG